MPFQIGSAELRLPCSQRQRSTQRCRTYPFTKRRRAPSPWPPQHEIRISGIIHLTITNLSVPHQAHTWYSNINRYQHQQVTDCGVARSNNLPKTVITSGWPHSAAGGPVVSPATGNESEGWAPVLFKFACSVQDYDVKNDAGKTFITKMFVCHIHPGNNFIQLLQFSRWNTVSE